MVLCRGCRRFSLKTLLRDATVMMAGTVLGILLSHVFFAGKSDRFDFASLCGVGGGTNSAPRLAKRGGNALEMLSRQYRPMPRPLPAVWGGVVNKPPPTSLQREEVSSSGSPPGEGGNVLSDAEESREALSKASDTLSPVHGDFGSADHDTTTETPPLHQKPHPPFRNSLLIGVLSTSQQSHTAISNTWGKRAQNLIYFTSSDKNKGEELLTGSGRHVITFPGNHDDDLRPHPNGAYHALKILHDGYIKEYEWFLLVDDKTYVRTQQLNSLVNKLDSKSEHCFSSQKDLMWRGSSSEEQVYRGLGGLGTIFSRSLLKKLAPHLEKCLMNVTASSAEKRGEDNVGRCLQERTAGLQCTRHNELTQQYVPHQLTQANSASRQQLLQAVMLRPLSEPQQMYRLHQFFIESAISSLKSRTSELVSELEGVALHLTSR